MIKEKAFSVYGKGAQIPLFFGMIPTLALPRSGAVEAYTSSQTVHRLPYVFIIITDLDDKSKKLIQITN